MNAKLITRICLISFAAVASGCSATGGDSPSPAHDNLDAVVWLQTSPEYAAVTSNVYAAASTALHDLARDNPERTKDMAIVLDIDETVLDNAAYQAQLILTGTSYGSESWDAWVASRSAGAVPGVVEFLELSQSLGFQVVFVTNRPCRVRANVEGHCPQHEDTLQNLESINVDTASTILYLMNDKPPQQCQALLSDDEKEEGVWSSDKSSRRACVEQDYEIVMLFGDQLGDFPTTEGHDSDNAGRSAAAAYSAQWGKNWFMLPNPTYGGWRPRTTEAKRSKLEAPN